MLNNLFRSSYLFFYVGIGLVLLAFFAGTITTEVEVTGSTYPDYMDFPSGFLILTPIIGGYGLTSLMLGIAELPMSKKENLLFFLPIFGVVYFWTLFIVWVILRFGSNVPFWLVGLILYLVPGITVSAVGFIILTKKEFLVRVLKKLRMRIAVSIIMVILPLVFAGALWQISLL